MRTILLNGNAPPNSNQHQKLEFWNLKHATLRMGGCGESSMTMSELTKHVLGLPSKLEWHPFRYIDFSEQAGVKKHQQVPVKNI